MKKNAKADQLEQKIRDLKDRYKHLKNCSSENILIQQSLPKSPVIPLNDIMRQDLKSHLPILKLQVSRDVSHLQKHKSPKPLALPTIYPTDISKVKTMLELQTALEPTPNHCGKESAPQNHSRKFSDIEEQTIEFLEKINSGYPSSRKEAENLTNWFIDMKNKYENEEDFESVIVICEQELVKSVLADCKNRGNLLKMIFSHYHSISIKNKEKAEEKLQNLSLDHEEKLKNLRKKLVETEQKIVNKDIELLNLSKKTEEIVKNLEEDVRFFKKKLQEMQRLYLEEQELWKKQWMNVSRRGTNKSVVLLHSSYNLAVTRLKENSYKSPAPVEPDFPEDIKRKIEKGEALDINELQKYREMYFQYQQDIQDLNFCDAEVQTEEAFKEFDEYSQRSSYVSEEFLQPSGFGKEKDEKNSEKIEGDGKKEKEFVEKEVQTDEFDGLNESELEEIKNFLENELVEGSDEDSELDEDEDTNSQIKSSWASVMTSKARISPESLDKNNDTVSQYKSPILPAETLGIVIESELEQDIQNNSKNEPSPDPQPTDKEVKPSEKKPENIQIKAPVKSLKEKPNMKSPDININKKRNSQLIIPKASNILTAPKSPVQGTTPRLQKNSTFSEAVSIKLSPDTQKPIENSKSINEPSKSPNIPNTENKNDEKPTKKSSKIIEKLPIASLISEKTIGNQSLENISESDSDDESFEDSKNLSVINKVPFSQSRSPDLIQSTQLLNSLAPELIKQASDVPKSSKRNSYLINVKQPSDRRGSMPLNFPRTSILKKDNTISSTNPQNRLSILLNNLKDSPVPNNLKLTTLSLVSKIQQKKKELAELERKIEEKKKILNDSESFNSEENSFDQTLNPSKKRMSANDLFKGVLKRISLIVPKDSEDQRRKSLSESLIKNLMVEELKRRQSVQGEIRRRSFASPTIKEEDEQDQDFDEFDSKVWESAYNAGFNRGKKLSLKNLALENENYSEGNSKYPKDAKIDYALDESKGNIGETSFTSGQGRFRKGFVLNEVKSNKETTKFAEFKFAKMRSPVSKPPSPVPELVKGFVKKSPDYFNKKAKAGKKMVNKIIANIYSSAIGRNGVEYPEELLEICYDEFTQRYGLKKVTDRKFLEFLASVLKIKTFKKPQMFIKLTGFGNYTNSVSYSKYTVNLYLNSLNYMLTSKVGINLNFDETDDKNLFPINRATECVKEKLDGIIDKLSILSIVSIIEGKAVPDPQRISTGLIELEYVLEFICDTYESQQKKIQKGVQIIFNVFGYEEKDMILQYDLALAVRYINPHKFQRMESEENLIQQLTFEETTDICIEMNVLSEQDIQNFIKSYQKVPFENYSELLSIIEKMEKSNSDWISIDENKWRERLFSCQKTFDPSSQLGTLAWKLYESELKRIETDYLHE